MLKPKKVGKIPAETLGLAAAIGPVIVFYRISVYIGSATAIRQMKRAC